MLNVFGKPHPGVTLYGAISCWTLVDATGELERQKLHNLHVNKAIYLAHCVSKALYLQLSFGLLVSFSFCFTWSLMLIRFNI